MKQVSKRIMTFMLAMPLSYNIKANNTEEYNDIKEREVVLINGVEE